ncbi:MAG: S49 family peptidase [Phycisphaeraceae bacterium]
MPDPDPRPPIERPSDTPPPPPPPAYMPMAPQPSGPRTALTRLLSSMLLGLLVLSLLANVYLGLIVSSLTGAGPREVVHSEGDEAHRIVVLPIEGLINDATYEFVRLSLRQLREDLPRAIVLRIDSSGGHMGASDRIFAEIERFKAELASDGRSVPIIASFGTIAASGGYYVAMPADTIFAETTTLTGSIGVMAPGFTIDRLLEKIGVTPEVIVAEGSPQKDDFGIHEPWDDEQRSLRRAMLEPAYERFVEVIQHGRPDLSEEQIRAAASGAVFTAGEALEQRLVDDVGYLHDAVALAAERAGIPDDVTPHVTRLQARGGFGPLGIFGYSPRLNVDVGELSAGQVRDWALEIQSPRAMYLMPAR